MKTKIIAVLVAAGALCALQTAQAHHPFAAEFDINKPVTLNGTLAKMEWVNPHGWIYLDVKGSDGTTKQWTIEASGPNQMARRGLKKTDFKAGGATGRSRINRRLAASLTTSAWRRTTAHSSSVIGARSVRPDGSITLATEFQTGSMFGSITLFITSRIDATGR